MLFNSYGFIFGFLPLALVFVFVLGRAHSATPALAWLAMVSCVFYALWDPWNLCVFVPSLVGNFLLGRAIASSARYRKVLLVAGVSLNLGALGYFKYTNFIFDSANTLLGSTLPLQQIVLPLGISFFTFEQIAYLVDTSRAQARRYTFVEYCVFVTFFPHLIAGPIIQHDELIEQLARFTRRFSAESFCLGVSMFVFGLFKKVVLADTVAAHVQPVYGLGAAAPDGFSAWMATVAYTLQLYFDFSGYSDMAIGLARMMNLRLPANFDSPYKAHNIIEFWRRWHMTLSRFLRHYLYVPLGGNRGGSTRRYTNLLLTMLLGGLWHGAGIGFVIWGGLNGCYLIVNHLFRKLRGAPKDNEPRGPWYVRELSILMTMFAVMTSRVFFRAPSLDAALGILRSLASVSGAELARGVATNRSAVLLLLALWVFCRVAPNSQEVLARYEPVLGNVRPHRWFSPTFNWGFGVALSLLFVTGLLMLHRVSEFLYFQF